MANTKKLKTHNQLKYVSKVLSDSETSRSTSCGIDTISTDMEDVNFLQDHFELIKGRLFDSEKSLHNKTVLIEIMRVQMREMEQSQKILIDEKNTLKIKYRSIVHDFITLKQMCKELKDDNKHLRTALQKLGNIYSASTGLDHTFIDKFLVEQKVVLNDITCKCDNNALDIPEKKYGPTDKIKCQRCGLYKNFMSIEDVITEYTDVISKLEGELGVLDSSINKLYSSNLDRVIEEDSSKQNDLSYINKEEKMTCVRYVRSTGVETESLEYPPIQQGNLAVSYVKSIMGPSGNNLSIFEENCQLKVQIQYFRSRLKNTEKILLDKEAQIIKLKSRNDKSNKTFLENIVAENDRVVKENKRLSKENERLLKQDEHLLKEKETVITKLKSKIDKLSNEQPPYFKVFKKKIMKYLLQEYNIHQDIAQSLSISDKNIMEIPQHDTLESNETCLLNVLKTNKSLLNAEAQKLSELLNDLENTKVTLDKVKEEREADILEKQSIQEELVKCQNGLEEAAAETNSFKRKLSELNMRLNSCQSSLPRIQKENQIMTRKVKSAEEQNSAMKNQLIEMQTKTEILEETQKQLRQSINEQANCKEEIKKAQSDLSKCNQELEEISAEKQRLTKEIESIQHTHNKIILELMAKCNEDRGVEEKAIFKIKSLEKLVEVLKKENKELKFKVVSLKQVKTIGDSYKVKLNETDIELNALKSEMTIIQRQIEQNNEDKEKLEKEMVEIQTQLTRALDDKRKLEIQLNEKEKMNEKISEVQIQLSKTMNEKNKLELEVKDLSQQVNNYKEVVEKLEQQKKEMVGLLEEADKTQSRLLEQCNYGDNVNAEFGLLKKLYEGQQSLYQRKLCQKEDQYNMKVREMDELVDKICLMSPQINDHVRDEMKKYFAKSIDGEGDIVSWIDQKAKILSEHLSSLTVFEIQIKDSVTRLLNKLEINIGDLCGNDRSSVKSILEELLSVLKITKAAENNKTINADTLNVKSSSTYLPRTPVQRGLTDCLGIKQLSSLPDPSEEENEIEICCQNYDKYSTVTSNDASEFIEHKENNNNLSTEKSVLSKKPKTSDANKKSRLKTPPRKSPTCAKSKIPVRERVHTESVKSLKLGNRKISEKSEKRKLWHH
ncbi:flagellar attachment zone protein 1 isoform X2 [Aethina tumida]|uniref:flagellar attachment zone protein 1 isoform X2 n=1 Tax=Aethina tumida TaxID=116153 RepID=UPI002148E47E|nr:flagellar attachment zone protein 1 isoform X2 [Aethina tumida]